MPLGKNKDKKKDEEKKGAAPETEAAAPEEKVETEATDTKQKAPDTKDPTPDTKEVAVKKPAPLPAMPAGKIVMALAEFQDVLPPMEFGTLPRLKASNGSIFDDDAKDLGREIEVTLVSMNDSFVISPGGSDNNNLCKFSHDGVFLNDGSGDTCEGYLQYLKDNDHDKAAMKKYAELVCILNDAEEDSEHIGGMVMISCSPSSLKMLKRYQLQAMLDVNKGTKTEEEISNFLVKAQAKTLGVFDFTQFVFKYND